MKERVKPGQPYYSAVFILGVLTAFNMFLLIGEPDWLTLILFGLATGAIGGTVILAAIKRYADADGGELSGRARRRIALLSGVVIGAALTPATAMARQVDGGLLFMVALVVGYLFSDRVRRMLGASMSPKTNSREHAENLEDEHAFRMLKFANDGTREQIAALALMMFGFALSAGVVLGVYVGLLAVVGR